MPGLAQALLAASSETTVLGKERGLLGTRPTLGQGYTPCEPWVSYLKDSWAHQAWSKAGDRFLIKETLAQPFSFPEAAKDHREMPRSWAAALNWLHLRPCTGSHTEPVLLKAAVFQTYCSQVNTKISLNLEFKYEYSRSFEVTTSSQNPLN